MEKPEPSLFAVLALVQKRPNMYLRGDDRGRQLEDLDALLSGYRIAVYQHGLVDEGCDAYSKFPDYLYARFDWSMSCGPIYAIRQHSANDDAAWEKFWELLWEFQREMKSSGEP